MEHSAWGKVSGEGHEARFVNRQRVMVVEIMKKKIASFRDLEAINRVGNCIIYRLLGPGLKDETRNLLLTIRAS